ncbi:MAG TPA: hypothetical protein VF897_21890, partial [Roseiflexaceae bacterium]
MCNLFPPSMALAPFRTPDLLVVPLASFQVTPGVSRRFGLWLTIVRVADGRQHPGAANQPDQPP